MRAKIFSMRAPACLLLLACWGANGTALAQVIYNNASTAGEGYSRGLGNVISAKGDYNLNTSEAAINMTQAQSNEIQNRQQWTNAYFDMRKVNRANRAEERGRQPTMEDAVRYAQMGKPKRLSPSEMDNVTGKITWPKLLRTEQFEDQRAKLDELFEKRARYGITFEDQMALREATNDMVAELKAKIRDLPPYDYANSKRFLESLTYEGQLPAG
jgi:hypothetical protein